MSEDYVTLECEQKRQTDDAILVEIDGDEHWLPKSQVSVEKIGGTFSRRIEITVPIWLARERGLE